MGPQFYFERSRTSKDLCSTPLKSPVLLQISMNHPCSFFMTKIKSILKWQNNSVPCMVFLPSHHHRVTSEKVMEYTGYCPHPTPRGQGTRLLSNDVEREYTSSLPGDIQLPYATQTTSSTLEQSPTGEVSTLGEIFYSESIQFQNKM